MSNWDILGVNNDVDDEEDVEYVGVIEEDAPQVQEPTRPMRQTVRRVAPRRMPTNQPFYPVAHNRRHQNGVVGSSNRDQEDLVSYVNIPGGKQLGLTPEAVERLATTPMTRLNGQMTQRIEPGTYVMYGPNRAEGMGDLYDEIIGGPAVNPNQGSQQAFTHTEWAQPAQQSGGGFSSWAGELFGAIAEVGTTVTQAIHGGATSRREAETERLRIEAEREAGASAREIAFQETQLAHDERIEQIRAGAAEVEALRAQQEEAAALRSQAPASQAPIMTSGGSPIVWILVGLLGLGAVGGVIYFVTRKKDED
jgi:hypothetical protein